MNQIHPNTIRQLFFIAVILLLFYILGKESYFMFSAILGAVTFWALMRKRMKKLVIDHKWSRPLAASLLMVASFLIIIVPFAWMASIIIDRIQPVFNNPDMVKSYIEKLHVYLLKNLNVDILSKENANSVVKAGYSFAPKLLGSALLTVSNLAVLYFVLYFLLVKFDSLEAWLRQVVPLKRSNREALLKELNLLVMSNAISIPLLALCQGIVAVAGFYIFGVEEPILWGIITGLCSVVPFVGTMAAWLPICLYLFAQGENGHAIGVMIWGFFVIGTTDNVFRLVLQKRLADIHPLITVFGVIIGVNLFGFFGLIFGPLMISLFLLLLKIYKDEFGENATEDLLIFNNNLHK